MCAVESQGIGWNSQLWDILPTNLWQDEERDSSDEEWDNAYASMDPISQLGWGNRCVEVERGASQLVRDVFVAADMVHEDAMSEVGEFNHTEEEWRGNMEADGDESLQLGTEGSMYAASSEEGDEEGEWQFNVAIHALAMHRRMLHAALGGAAARTLS